MILPTIWMVCLMATTAVGSGEKLSMSLQQSGFHRFYNLLIYASVPENKCYILEIYDTLHISCSPGNQTHATIASHRLFQLVPTSIPISWTIWSDSIRCFCSNWFVYKINHFQYIFFKLPDQLYDQQTCEYRRDCIKIERIWIVFVRRHWISLHDRSSHSLSVSVIGKAKVVLYLI